MVADRRFFVGSIKSTQSLLCVLATESVHQRSFRAKLSVYLESNFASSQPYLRSGLLQIEFNTTFRLKNLPEFSLPSFFGFNPARFD